MGDLFGGGILGMAVDEGSDFLEEDKPDDPLTAKQLEADANKVAEKKRLARVGDRETKGKTMYSQPMAGGGIPLKEDLGA